MNICLNFFIVKCKMSALWMIETVSMFTIFLAAIVPIKMECETQEN